jgi:hypothetical protein
MFATITHIPSLHKILTQFHVLILYYQQGIAEIYAAGNLKAPVTLVVHVPAATVTT